MSSKKFLDTPPDVRQARNEKNYFKNISTLDGQKYYEEVESHSKGYDKFGIKKHVTRFYFKKPPNATAVDAFKHTIEKLIDEGCKNDDKILKISLNLHFKEISDPIIIPPRPKDQNTPDVVLNELRKLEQSYSELNLFEQEASFIVTTYCLPEGTK